MDAQTLPTAIRTHCEELARDVLARQYVRLPQLRTAYGPAGVAKALDDACWNLRYLAEAIAGNCPLLFKHYMSWLWTMVEPYGVTREQMSMHLGLVGEVLTERLPGIVGPELHAVLAAGREGLLEAEPPLRMVQEHAPHAARAERYLAALLDSDRGAALAVVQEAAGAGLSVPDIYLHILQPVQHEIGRLWQTRRITVAQEHYATAVTQLAMAQLYPVIARTPKNARKMVATCVGSELHELGVRMVADFFELAGWDAYFIGAGAPVPALVQTIVQRQPDVVAISATIVVHLSEVRRLIQAIRMSAWARPLIMVGGYPFNAVPDLWKIVGADTYAADAQSAVRIAAERLNGS